MGERGEKVHGFDTSQIRPSKYEKNTKKEQRMKRADKGRYMCWQWGEGERGNVGHQAHLYTGKMQGIKMQTKQMLRR